MSDCSDCPVCESGEVEPCLDLNFGTCKTCGEQLPIEYESE